MMEFHHNSRAKVTIALTPVEDPTIYGVVETSAEGRVQRFIEKPHRDAVTTNMINAGAYIIAPDVLSHIPNGLNFSFEHGLFPLLLERGDPVYGYQSNAYWIDIGTPEKYLMLHHDLLEGQIARVFPGKPTNDGIWLEEGCNIHKQAHLEGTVIIGRNCVIGSMAHIKGPSIIGHNCKIDTDSLVDGSVVWQNSELGRKVSIRNCVIGENVVIGERSQCMEGCVLGSNVVVGNDQILEQGTKVWPDDNL
jgi:mannose-1-phosphate guanylyltransferase